MTGVQVDLVTTTPVASRPEMLEPSEVVLWERFRYDIDRDRHFTGVMLRQAVLSQRAGHHVPVTRRCRGCGAGDHGEVQPSRAADRARWRTSLSHCETAILLAVAEFDGAADDIEIGVDVESVSRMDAGMARHMLSAPERSRLAQHTPWLLCGIWTAKEAALKALGCGLHVSATHLEVTTSADPCASTVRPVGADPRLQPLRDRPSRLIDITAVVSAAYGDDPQRRAALLVLGTEDVQVVQRRLETDDLWSAIAQWTRARPDQGCATG